MAEERIEVPPEEEAREAEEAGREEKRAAVALRYDVDRDRAPLVLASGRGRKQKNSPKHDFQQYGQYNGFH